MPATEAMIPEASVVAFGAASGTATPAMARPSSATVIVDALRRVRSLDGLSDVELQWLTEHGIERFVENGTKVFSSGERAHIMTILLEGEVHVRRVSSGPTVFFIGRSSQLTGKLPFSRMQTYGGEGYAVGQVWAIDVHEDLFPAMLEAIPSMAQRCVSLLLDRVREVTRMEQQSEKLNALGKLAANLSHELNNPASAARSAANNLWTELRNYGDSKYKLGAMCFTAEAKKRYGEWMNSVRGLMDSNDHPYRADAGTLGDREIFLNRWMIAHNVTDAWKITPTLAETRIEISHLDALAEALSPEALPVALASFSSALNAERMTDAVIDATHRIFDLITAIKDYSYMDQAPIQEIDVPQAIENTLTMLASRLANVEIVREYAPDTPTISAYGSELNQVWTALIENALDAMDSCEHDPHILRLRTSLNGLTLLVEIEDNGPGIDPDIHSRIFEPFFTTKPVGVSLGLGLDAANRILTKHRGSITVESRPGRTCFQVRLPVEQAGAY